MLLFFKYLIKIIKNFFTKRKSISKFETILEGNNVKYLISKSIESVSHKIDEKLELSQKETDCERKTVLVCDLENQNHVYCGLGCQLHGFSSGLLCATEHRRHYTVINYLSDQYENYFSFFKQSCMINEQIKLAGKLGTSL